jgi:urease accessory protein
MRRVAAGSLWALAALALGAPPAHAHDAFGNAGAFWGGFLHPLTALEHVLAIVAFGLLAGLQSPRPAFAALLAFALALALGGIAGMAGWLPPDLGFAAAGSIAVVALLVALARPLPPAVLMALAVGLGLLHGAANGAAVPAGVDRIAFLLGIVAGPALVAHLLIGAVRRLEAPWTRIAVRVLGSWLAAVGLLVLGRFVLTPSAIAG